MSQLSPEASEAAIKIIAGYRGRHAEHPSLRFESPFLAGWESHLAAVKGVESYDDLLEAFSKSDTYRAADAAFRAAWGLHE